MGLGHDDISVEVGRILASGVFKRSGRLSRFLQFVVDSALEGKHEQLKEYVLGVEVYQKGADFDPRIDSTVRVEAARLRGKLREYYETEGRDDSVRIELPKGGYAPLFRRVGAPASRARYSPVRMAWIAGVLVLGCAAVVLLAVRSRPEPPMATRVRPLTTLPGQEIHPCYSPDGKQIAMVWSGENDDNRDIYVRPVGEGRPVRLTTHPEPDRSPAWSPDGLHIAFARDSPTGVELYLVPAAGGAERLIIKLRRRGLPHSMPVARTLDWFPDGQALLVTDQDSAVGTSSLFRVSIETGDKRRLTSPPPQSRGDLQPAVSPDGRMLAFVRSCPACDIYVASASGGDVRRITFEKQVVSGLAWSEDGKSIVFSSERGATAGAGSLWRVAVGGPSAARLEQIPGVGPRASQPAIARRSRLLAYQESFQDTNLWQVPANGSGAPKLVISSTREETLPDYSPDGSRIVFNSNRSGHWEIWIANADGSHSRQLTSNAGPPASYARWSPNGRLIAFSYAGEGNGDIYTMTPEGASIRRLTSETSRDETPAFSKDGRWIYFSSNRSGVFEIWKLAADYPAELVQVTHGGGSWPIESPDGKHLYFRRESEIWRLPVNGGAEIRVLGPMNVSSWMPGRTGIYFIERAGRIAFHVFATGRTSPVIPLRQEAMVGLPGLTLSPDGRSLLYGQKDRAWSDIMLVENFQ
jgi:Tol biopolymer transport system component